MTKKSEMITEVEPIKAKSYKELDLLYENLKEEYTKFAKDVIKDGEEYESKINDISKKLENQEKKNAGLERTIKKLKDRIGILDRNMAKKIKAWNKDKNRRKSDENLTNDSQSDTPKETESETKVDKKKKEEEEERSSAPWMSVGC